MAGANKKRILILGAGFGGLYAAIRLQKTLAHHPEVELTLVDKANFSLFTPMLHEVAASDIDASDIVNPVRKMLKRGTFYEAQVEAIDLQAKAVTIEYGLPRHQRKLEYDFLLIAMGSSTKFFDDQTRAHAIQFKSLGDAMLLRNRMIALLESASVEEDPAVRSRLMTFTVAGGGFAGVETIGAMNDFLREAVELYPLIDKSLVRLVLVHPGPVLLPEFSKSLGEYTTEQLKKSGIDVRLNTKVSSYDGQVVKIDPGEPIVSGTLLWTAGVAPGPLIESLPMKKEKGRIVVNACMESDEFPGVWVVGDCASIPNPFEQNKPYPATAQHAIRQGQVVGANIEAAVLGGKRQKPFEYKMLGQLAAIGQRRGAAQILGLNFSGFFAWWLWRTAYLYKLPRLEKKIRVAMGWTIDLFFSRDLVQLITRDDIKRLGTLSQRFNFDSPPGDHTGDGQPKGEPPTRLPPAQPQPQQTAGQN